MSTEPESEPDWSTLASYLSRNHEMRPHRTLGLRGLGTVSAYAHPPGQIEVPKQETDTLIYHVSGTRAVSRRTGVCVDRGSRPGSFAHIAAGTQPVFEVAAPCKVLHFDVPSGLVPQNGFFNRMIQQARPIAATLAEWMWSERPVRGAEAIATGLVLGAADFLGETTATRGGLRHSVRRDLGEWIDQELAEPLSELSIAERAGLSPGHLRRAFRESFGLPPMRYVATRRAFRARLLLDAGEPAAVVAKKCGLSGPRALRDLLRRH
ncbi:MAG: AraC family transcriptional regulator [Myxococcota bacterium]